MYSLYYAGLRVLDPAGADGGSQVDEAAAGGGQGGDGAELEAGPPPSKNSTRTESAERKHIFYVKT